MYVSLAIIEWGDVAAACTSPRYQKVLGTLLLTKTFSISNSLSLALPFHFMLSNKIGEGEKDTRHLGTEWRVYQRNGGLHKTIILEGRLCDIKWKLRPK